MGKEAGTLLDNAPRLVRQLLALCTRQGRGTTQERAYGCSTIFLVGFTCPAITVATAILRALDRVRGRALGLPVLYVYRPLKSQEHNTKSVPYPLLILVPFLFFCCGHLAPSREVPRGRHDMSNDTLARTCYLHSSASNGIRA